MTRPFSSRYEVTESGCWSWSGLTTHDGYGRLWVPGTGHRLAHRYSYESLVGPIPDGLQIDHLCRNRRCVNPAHLEPVTPQENSARGMEATKAFCRNGHPFDEKNTYRHGGRRHCRACNSARAAAYQARLRGARTVEAAS